LFSLVLLSLFSGLLSFGPWKIERQPYIYLDTCLCKRIICVAGPEINYCFVFGCNDVMAQYHSNTFKVKNVRACDSEKQQVVCIINDIRQDGKFTYGTWAVCREKSHKNCRSLIRTSIDTRGAFREGVPESASTRENYTPHNTLFNKKQKNSIKHRHLLHYNQFLMSPLQDYLHIIILLSLSSIYFMSESTVMINVVFHNTYLQLYTYIGKWGI